MSPTKPSDAADGFAGVWKPSAGRGNRLAAVLFLTAALSALSPAKLFSLPRFSDDEHPRFLAASIVRAMTDEEALGQVLMFGYPGDAADPTILRRIREEGLGSVKIFGWNAVNLPNLARAVGRYQREALEGRFGIPLLVATDQEGGWVRHIKGETSRTPGNMALGAGRLPYDALETGRIIGRELAAVGVNMNFAPTVDVFVDPRADVIGPRAFMADPGWSGVLGLAFFKGHEEFGVISTAKHFPGHGDTSEDSHGTLPAVTADMETLRERDLMPYRTLIAGGIPAVMAGHLAFPNITGDGLPATLSRYFLTDILRGEMGFEGVAVTDDLLMAGARSDGAGLDDVSYRALAAGADLLLISQGPADHTRIYNRLLAEMKSGGEFALRVREAAGRVVALKAAYLKRPGGVPLEPDSGDIPIPAAGAEDYFLGQAARSITVIREGRLPLPAEDAGKVLLAGSFQEFFAEGLRRYPEAATWQLPYEDTAAEMRDRGRKLLRAVRSYDTVIVALPDEETAILLNELEPAAEKVVVMSVLSPAHVARLDWTQTALAAYGIAGESFKAAFAAISGDFVPRGRLPIPLGGFE